MVIIPDADCAAASPCNAKSAPGMLALVQPIVNNSAKLVETLRHGWRPGFRAAQEL